jgi:hypothetical protein
LKEGARDSLARQVAAFGVRAEVRDDVSCKNDVFAPKPCPEAVQAFKQFARENGLPETRSTAQMFYAYVEGDKETGDELYAFLSGKNADQPRNELLAEVRSYRVPAEEKRDTSCENNYFAAKPCMAAVSAWRDFSRKHGLALTRQTADLFQAYIAGDEVTGDKLYAARCSASTVRAITSSSRRYLYDSLQFSSVSLICWRS